MLDYNVKSQTLSKKQMITGMCDNCEVSFSKFFKKKVGQVNVRYLWTFLLICEALLQSLWRSVLWLL